MDFRAWLETVELDDPVTTAILGEVAPDQTLSDDDKERELSRNTNELSNEIQDKIKELGIVKQAQDSQGIGDAIEDGITVKELIEKIKGHDYAPNSGTQPLVDPTLNAQPNQQAYIQP